MNNLADFEELWTKSMHIGTANRKINFSISSSSGWDLEIKNNASINHQTVLQSKVSNLLDENSSNRELKLAQYKYKLTKLANSTSSIHNISK